MAKKRISQRFLLRMQHIKHELTYYLLLLFGRSWQIMFEQALDNWQLFDLLVSHVYDMLVR